MAAKRHQPKAASPALGELAASGAGERLAPPSARARALMAEHLRAEHRVEPFSLARHVYLGDRRGASQLLSWDPSRAAFTCKRCPGVVFWSGELTSEDLQRSQRFDPALKPHLAGLTDPADRDEITRRYLDGSLNAERLRQLRAPAARRRAATGKRPSIEPRKRRLQAWMLGRVAQVGVLERVLDAAERMQRDDPEAWAKLCERNLSKETLRDYWQDIPQPGRDAAWRAFTEAAEKFT